MYENYTRQSLQTKRYRELLDSAICIFNPNKAFLIENIWQTGFSYKSKKNSNQQFYITEDYLLEFIKLKQQLSDKLHSLRGY